MAITGTFRAAALGCQVHRGRGIGAKPTGDERVALPGPGHLFGAQGGHLVDEHGAEAELAEGIGDVGGDGKGAPEAEEVDGVGAGKQRGRAARGPMARQLERSRSIEAMALSAKPSRRSLLARSPCGATGPILRQPFAIVGPAGLELGAEDLLKVGEAGVPMVWAKRISVDGWT